MVLSWRLSTPAEGISLVVRGLHTRPTGPDTRTEPFPGAPRWVVATKGGEKRRFPTQQDETRKPHSDQGGCGIGELGVGLIGQLSNQQQR